MLYALAPYPDQPTIRCEVMQTFARRLAHARRLPARRIALAISLLAGVSPGPLVRPVTCLSPHIRRFTLLKGRFGSKACVQGGMRGGLNLRCSESHQFRIDLRPIAARFVLFRFASIPHLLSPVPAIQTQAVGPVPSRSMALLGRIGLRSLGRVVPSISRAMPAFSSQASNDLPLEVGPSIA